MCKSVFFISFQSLNTVGKSFRSLEKSMNFTQICLYEPRHRIFMCVSLMPVFQGAMAWSAFVEFLDQAVDIQKF